ncbi:MAG: tetratricopeptide repeat protein [Deltaproteobacteria bacterium]|jgi:tetratricopeptide (TPR) repeat protein|nr:tetratricopeptide repeat protein [Deltaproteobacteria bacterium]
MLETLTSMLPLLAAAVTATATFRAGTLLADGIVPLQDKNDRENTVRGLMLLESIFQRLTKELGEDHIEVLRTMDAMALARARLGERKRSEGIMNSFANIASGMMDKKNYKGAIEALSMLVPTRERILGPDDLATLRSLARLGVSLNRTGKNVEAERIFRKVAEGRERTLGSEDPLTMDARGCQGIALFCLNEHERARELLEPIAGPLALVKDKVFSELMCMPSTGRVLSALGNYGPARDLLSRSAALARKNLGPSHNTTLCREEELAKALEGLGEIEAAAKLLEKVASESEKGPGADPERAKRAGERLEKLLKDRDDSE